jgi:hexokinase
MKIAEFFAQNAFSPDIDTDALLAEFDRQMDAGLAGGKSSLAMIPAYVDADRAVKTDTPINVLDAGGTNLRVATVRFDKAGKAKIEGLRKCAMPGTDGTSLSAEAFFDRIAEVLEPVAGNAKDVGFCFSYPTEITPALDGRLMRWTKQVDAPGVVGKMIGSGVAAAVKRRLGRKPAVRVLNDTVATLLAGKSVGISRRYASYVGFILGTGTNIAYIERNARIGKVKRLDRDRAMVINIESGNFDGGPASAFDVAVDAATSDPGIGRFEKMISGRYMGDLGLVVLKRAAAAGLFSKRAAAGIAALAALTTKDFDDFVANPFTQGGAFDAVRFTDNDRRALLAICEPVFARAARLAAANIAAAVIRCGEGRDPLHPVCVTIDGSTYYRTRTGFFKSRVEQGLRDILGARGIHFETTFVEDAPVVGAAVAGLIAQEA